MAERRFVWTCWKSCYDKDDETKTDYSEELTLLCRLWQEKLPDHEEVWRNRA